MFVTLITGGWGAGRPPAGPLLTPDQIGDAIVWALSQPPGVDVNTLVVRPVGQNV